MVHVDEDATRVQTALDALDNVSAANLNADSFEAFADAVRKLEGVEESLVEHPDCSVAPREDGDA